MVFAAGMGKLMRPLTDHMPKPMIPINGKTMLARALDALEEAKVNKAVVNTHYKADIVKHYIASRLQENRLPHIDISHEETLLETGGGILHAKELLGNNPIYTINSDIIWKDGKNPALQRLADMWDSKKMDALLLLQPRDKAFGYDGKGNFALTENGQLKITEAIELPYVYTGIQIINPTVFYGMKEEAFSLNVLYKNARQQDSKLHRVFGLVHDAQWYHIGTADAVKEVEAIL